MEGKKDHKESKSEDHSQKIKASDGSKLWKTNDKLLQTPSFKAIIKYTVKIKCVSTIHTAAYCT